MSALLSLEALSTTKVSVAEAKPATDCTDDRDFLSERDPRSPRLPLPMSPSHVFQRHRPAEEQPHQNAGLKAGKANVVDEGKEDSVLSCVIILPALVPHPLPEGTNKAFGLDWGR